MPSGFVEVSGYSQADLDAAYAQGKADEKSSITKSAISVSVSVEGGTRTNSFTMQKNGFIVAVSYPTGHGDYQSDWAGGSVKVGSSTVLDVSGSGGSTMTNVSAGATVTLTAKSTTNRTGWVTTVYYCYYD